MLVKRREVVTEFARQVVTVTSSGGDGAVIGRIGPGENWRSADFGAAAALDGSVDGGPSDGEQFGEFGGGVFSGSV